MVYCSNCGKLLPEPVPLYCPYCGKENTVSTTRDSTISNNNIKYVKNNRKDPVIAAILGLIIPGLGHIYLGNYKMAILLFILAVFLSLMSGFLELVIAIASAWTAYDEAKNINELRREC